MAGQSAAAAGTKTVTYDGYAISVPSSWPVYRLDTDPAQCVRYDINAVYLGNAGADQACPPDLIGRGATISITGPGASGAPPVDDQRAAVSQGGLGGSFPAVSPDRRAGSLPAVQGSLDQYSEQGEFRATFAHSDVSVTATYGQDPAQVETILRSMRRVSGGPARQAAYHVAAGPGQPRAAATSSDSRARTRLINAAKPAATRGSVKPSTPAGPATTFEPSATLELSAALKPAAPPEPAATPKPAPAQTPAAPLTSAPSPGPAPSAAEHLAANVRLSAPVNGFDTCTAPSLAAMKAWKSKYSAVGIYIGGQEMACDYGNLSASWVASTHSMGWSLLPIYVGLQAPCNSFHGKINAKNAGTQGGQGKTAADTAIGDVNNFGMGRGTPIYFDMEAYDHSNSGCKAAVLTFLDAWTRELHARGYVSGTYSSAGSGVSDLASTGRVNGRALAEPDAMWFALWDNADNLTGTPYLPASSWASDRVKQYSGGHTQKIGGYRLDIDSDRVGGAVSGP
jgi:hypothetical protein